MGKNLKRENSWPARHRYSQALAGGR